MTRYFITGAQGFVGRHLVAHLLATDRNAEILGTGRSAENRACFTHQVSWGQRRLSAPLPIELQVSRADRRYRYLSLDLADVDETSRDLRRFRPDVVIHLASALRGDSSLSQFRTNAEGSLQLLSALERADVEPARIVFGSTGGVYGLPDACDLPLREDSPCRPADIYGVSKLAAEQATRLETRRLKWPAVWARIFNVVGIGQDERHVCGRLASQAAAIVRGEITPRLEVGGLESTRDFIDVRDVARALAFLAHHEQPDEIVNVASGREMSIGDVLRLTLSRCGLSGRVEIVPSVSRGEATRHIADVRRLTSLGFSAAISLEQSLDELIRYYLNQVASMAA